MDISLLLILMAVLYILPEIFKRRRSKKYEYPHQIPDPPPRPPVPAQEPEPAGYDGNIQYTIPAAPALQEKNYHPSKLQPTAPVHQADPTVSAWQGSLNPSMILNGIIFAEIIQPPRAKRPLHPGLVYARRRQRGD